MWLNSRWDVVGRLASVGFIGVGGLWCGWCVVVARVGFVVVGVGVAWWVRVGVGMVDFFFLCWGGGGGGGCGCVCVVVMNVYCSGYIILL